jgi:hypothetical protein
MRSKSECSISSPVSVFFQMEMFWEAGPYTFAELVIPPLTKHPLHSHSIVTILYSHSYLLWQHLHQPIFLYSTKSMPQILFILFIFKYNLIVFKYGYFYSIIV